MAATFPTTGALGDPNAYRAIFFEETAEHLAQVESILLRLQPGQPCQDELNAIFRAVHSIKGSASMLGCADMAALTHLEENLLDVLRKQERPLEPADVDAMLRAGDTVGAQALRHRGVIDQAPDAAPAEALLREQLARPRSDAKAGVSGPVTRRFAVRLGPLAEPIADEELEMMLTGLAEMGSVSATQVDNAEGGSVSFEVQLEGTQMDLQSVLALLVAPELIAIDKREAGAPEVTLESPPPALAADIGDEFFVDPEEFRKKRERKQESVDARVPQPVAPVATAESGYIRVSVEKIDLLVNLVGELVITEAMLARTGLGGVAQGQGRLVENGLADLSRHTRNLQEAVLAIRMLPISNVFSRFPRLAHELSAQLGKQVELKFTGEATELDRGMIEKISDPLTHLVRNAIDHGIETPGVREAAGKPATGTLRLKASQRGGNIVIEVSDDGRGLDRERILAKAKQRGIAIAPDASDNDLWQLIFEPGFSTAETVTEVSGRGVGMDVVRRNIQGLGGTIDLMSMPGYGTTFTVSVPLTLAIMDAMTIAFGGETYVLPLAAVVESLSIEAGQLHTLPGHGDTLQVRGDFLPVLHLAKLFPPQKGLPVTGGIAVIVESDGNYAALIVDELVGQQQVVVKSLEANFRKVPGLSGATVMGDGSVAFILDVNHLVRASGRAAMLL